MKAHTIRSFLSESAKNMNAEDIIAYYYYPDVSDLVGVKDTLF
jgi:hypothetical protein